MTDELTESLDLLFAPAVLALRARLCDLLDEIETLCKRAEKSENPIFIKEAGELCRKKFDAVAKLTAELATIRSA